MSAKCNATWTTTLKGQGKKPLIISHECGEIAGHKGSHRCQFCGVGG